MRFITKRVLWAIPTLFAIVLIGFGLTVNTSDDPVKTVMGLTDQDDPLKPVAPYIQNAKKEWENKLGLNLPLFYISIQSSAIPDTIYKITDRKERSIIRKLCLTTGQTQVVMGLRTYIGLLKKTWIENLKSMDPLLKDSLQTEIDEITQLIILLSIESNKSEVNKYVIQIYDKTNRTPFWSTNAIVERLSKSFFLRTGNSNEVWIPKIRFHKQSRFHQWMFGDGKYSKGIIRGDFGISYITKEPVKNHIYTNLFWSVLFSGIGILLAYLISIPIGIRSAIHNNKIGEKIVTILLFLLYAIPVFFLGTLLQTYLANNHYLHIFEPTGIKPVGGYPVNSSLFERIGLTIPYMILPTICFTYSSIAFLTRLTKNSILEILNQPFIITAKAKGLTQ